MNTLFKTLFTLVLSVSLVVSISVGETSSQIDHVKRDLITSSKVGVLEKRKRDGNPSKNTVTCPGGHSVDLRDCERAATCLADKKTWPGSNMMISGGCGVVTYSVETGNPYVTKTWSAIAIKYLVEAGFRMDFNCQVQNPYPFSKEPFNGISQQELTDVGIDGAILDRQHIAGASCSEPNEDTRKYILQQTAGPRVPHDRKNSRK